MEYTLVVLAAGMGSRYGGLKQLDPMGPNGATVLDYSVYDALRAGFKKVVFVIREDFAAAFQAAVGSKFEDRMEVAYAYQDLADLPEGYAVPAGREKPWGTAHAVRAARAQVEGPFAVINADDFYGAEAYARMIAYFKSSAAQPELRSALVAYPLELTLSEHGSVNRGLCTVVDGCLQSVEEHEMIERGADGLLQGRNLVGESVSLQAEAPVSMNFWGFTLAFFASLEAAFVSFLDAHGGEAKSECYLPSVVDGLIREEQTECMVLESRGQWFGVTYPEDKPLVQARIADLVSSGAYPEQI
ncbi:MAG: nucleotidyltransferase family protein [Opitutales bacterium]